MSCAITSDYNFTHCKGGQGGIREVMITEHANLAAAPTVTSGTHTITAMALTTGKEFKVYTLDKEMGYFSNKGSYITNSGAILYKPEIGFTMKGLTDAITSELHLVAKNNLLIMVRDNNDNVWLAGLKNGMDLTEWDASSGTSFGDLNGYVTVFKGQEPAPLYKVTEGLIATLCAPAA